MQTLSEEEYENLSSHLRGSLLKAPPIMAHRGIVWVFKSLPAA
jgi:hypothetical protein